MRFCSNVWFCRDFEKIIFFWKVKDVILILDLFLLKRNVVRFVKSFELFEYIWDCIRMSYLYFGLLFNFLSFFEEE